MPTHVFSLSEAAVKDAHEKNRQALLNHNRDFLMRVYPSGIRLNSSNLNPIFFWQQGAQMVALNWQICDKGMMINDAMFPNGVGWVKKPSVYRNIANNADSCSNALPDGTIQTLDLSIDIYAGQNIRNLTESSASGKGFRPYIICQLHLCKAEDILTDAAEVDKNSKAASANDKSSKKYKLRTKTSTGNDPDFQVEKMEFPRAERILQDMSFIRYVIIICICLIFFFLALVLLFLDVIPITQPLGELYSPYCIVIYADYRRTLKHHHTWRQGFVLPPVSWKRAYWHVQPSHAWDICFLEFD
jgi:hypothetical protein